MRVRAAAGMRRAALSLSIRCSALGCMAFPLGQVYGNGRISGFAGGICIRVGSRYPAHQGGTGWNE